MIAGCAVGMKIALTWRLGLCIVTRHCLIWTRVLQGKNRGAFFFSRMVMNDLMEVDKKVSALAIMCEWDRKGDLKHIVGGWKYQRERMGRNNRLQTRDRQNEQLPKAPRARLSPPPEGNEMCSVFRSGLRAKCKRPDLQIFTRKEEKYSTLKELIPRAPRSALRAKDQLFYEGKLCSVLMCYCKN